MQLEEDKKKFAEVFSSFTGISKTKLLDFLKDNKVSAVFEHPTALEISPKQLEKINYLKEMNSLYGKLKAHETEYIIDSSPKAGNFFKSHFADKCDKEGFAVAFLNSQNRVMAVKEMFGGTINESPVYPREIAKAALLYDAHTVLISHNHPGGSLKPSSADIEVTKKIAQSLASQNIHLPDHIIISNRGYYSFAEDGLMDSVKASISSLKENSPSQYQVSENPNKQYHELGKKIEAGQHTPQDIERFNQLQEQRLKQSVESAKQEAPEPKTEIDLTR